MAEITYVTTTTGNLVIGTDRSATVNSISIAVNYDNVLANIANSLHAIANSLEVITLLGGAKTANSINGAGFKVLKPYEWVGTAALYKFYVEQGLAASNTGVANTATQNNAINRLNTFRQNIVDKLGPDFT